MKKLFVVIICLGIVAIVGIRLYEELSTEAGGPGGGPGGGLGQPLMLVQTAPVETRSFASRLEALGELKPQASVDVMGRATGRLSEVLVQRGDPVEKGQLIATVDDEDLSQQIRRAEASILVARAAVNREEATAENLKVQLKRTKALHEEELVSTQDLEDLESRMRVAEAQLELSKASVEQAEASLHELKIQQQYTQIHSPLTGFVGTRHLDPGALVNPSVPIVTVIEVSRVKIVVPVTEQALSQVSVGVPTQIRVDAYPQDVYRGVVTRISPFLDPETRSADVEIEIPNRNGRLKPGMFARVTVDAVLKRSALAIPRAALLTRGDQKGVYLLSDELTTRFQPIEIGRIEEDHVEVLSGLQEGMQVVTSGAQKLNEGDKVRLG